MMNPNQNKPSGDHYSHVSQGAAPHGPGSLDHLQNNHNNNPTVYQRPHQMQYHSSGYHQRLLSDAGEDGGGNDHGATFITDYRQLHPTSYADKFLPLIETDDDHGNGSNGDGNGGVHDSGSDSQTNNIVDGLDSVESGLTGGLRSGDHGSSVSGSRAGGDSTVISTSTASASIPISTNSTTSNTISSSTPKKSTKKTNKKVHDLTPSTSANNPRDATGTASYSSAPVKRQRVSWKSKQEEELVHIVYSKLSQFTEDIYPLSKLFDIVHDHLKNANPPITSIPENENGTVLSCEQLRKKLMPLLEKNKTKDISNDRSRGEMGQELTIISTTIDRQLEKLKNKKGEKSSDSSTALLSSSGNGSGAGSDPLSISTGGSANESGSRPGKRKERSGESSSTLRKRPSNKSTTSTSLPPVNSVNPQNISILNRTVSGPASVEEPTDFDTDLLTRYGHILDQPSSSTPIDDNNITSKDLIWFLRYMAEEKREERKLRAEELRIREEQQRRLEIRHAEEHKQLNDQIELFRGLAENIFSFMKSFTDSVKRK